ncbi:TPA: hypothetical protein JLP82_000167 [Escherichia coli]|nr:hypothetical protein [Escherichia coli]
MKKKLISGLFLMLWMALLIAAMVYPQGIFPVLAASGVWVACLLTWAVIPVALAALIQNGPLWQELRASLLKTITRKENVFISWVMRLLIVVSLAWTGWAIRCSAQSDRSSGYCTGRRGAGCLEILATHHRISRWRGGGIQSGGRSRQCRIRTT